MQTFVLVVHVLLAIGMIVLVLVQHGKGADAGASFGGGGGAGTVFGASGSGNFLTRLTGVLTALFFVTSITLAVFAKKQTVDAYSLVPDHQAPVTAPATNSSVNSTNAPKTAN